MRELKSSGVTRDFTRKICCSKMYCISNNGVNFGFKMLWRQKKKKKSQMYCSECVAITVCPIYRWAIYNPPMLF